MEPAETKTPPTGKLGTWNVNEAGEAKALTTTSWATPLTMRTVGGVCPRVKGIPTAKRNSKIQVKLDIWPVTAKTNPVARVDPETSVLFQKITTEI